LLLSIIHFHEREQFYSNSPLLRPLGSFELYSRLSGTMGNVGFIEIDKRKIGTGYPVYVVAELSANHGQKFEEAVKLIKAAKQAGADAVKLQTYTPDTMTLDSDQDCFRIKGTIWDDKTLYSLYAEAFTPWDWHPKLQSLATDLGLDFFSTPFDASSVQFLESLNVPAYKIASFETVDLPLLRRVAHTVKPVIMSTGMMTLAEIQEAVATLRGNGNKELVLLKCTSAYPAPPEEMNLRTLPDLADTFGAVVGISDHTLGTSVPVAAVALGASVVEKHLTLSRSVPGPDATFSLEPEEFALMVTAIRQAEKVLGTVHYGPTPHEHSSVVFRRSLFVTEDMAAGETFTNDNVRSIRPGQGLHTRHLGDVIGQRASRAIKKGTPLSWDLVSTNNEEIR